MERERGLTVKQAVASFEPSTLYGNRVGFQDILLVTSSKGNNIFHKSKLWKTALVTDISMLPRQQMLKPPRPDNRYGVDTRFTKVQEMKQAGHSIEFHLIGSTSKNSSKNNTHPQ